MHRILILFLLLPSLAFAERYNGSTWDSTSFKRYNGSAWVDCSLYRYNGSSWDYLSGSACSGDIGTKSGAEYNVWANSAFLVQVTANCTGSVKRVGATLKDIDTGTRRVIYVAYDDDGGSGEPGTLLWESDPFWMGPSAGVFIQLQQYISGGLSVTNGDNLWVGVIFESGDSDHQGDATGGTGRFDSLASFAAPATWDAAGDTDSAYDRAFWITYD